MCYASLLLSFNLHAALPEYFYKHFTGIMQGKIGIEMDLQRKGEFVSGSYFYKATGKLMEITGQINDDGVIDLEEYEQETNTGNLHLIFFTNNNLSGTWTDLRKTISLKIELVEDYSSSVCFKSIFLNEAHQLIKGKPEPAASSTMLILYPSGCSNKFEINKLRNIILSQCLGKDSDTANLNKSFEQYNKNFFKDYLNVKDVDIDSEKKTTDAEETDESEATENAYNWYNNLSMSIILNNKEVLSFALTSDDYTGGAHGNYNISYYNFSFVKGDTLNLKDILKPEFERQLSKIIMGKLSEQANKEGKKQIPLSKAGYFRDTIPYNNNFYLRPTGIGFVYNPNEIAPSAMGMPEVFIPFSELRPLLKAESPISSMIK
jgi:hypothetical protein